MNSDLRRRLVERTAAENEVSPELIQSLLDLEAEFQNLHAWGTMPALKRRIMSLVDASLAEAKSVSK